MQIVAIFALLTALWSFDAHAQLPGAMPGLGGPTMPVLPDHCVTRMCPRIYRPLCLSYNGRMRTESNRCMYNMRRNCYAKINQQGKTSPSLRFVHNRACNSRSQRIAAKRFKNQKKNSRRKAKYAGTYTTYTR